MAIYLSRRNTIEESLDCDVNTVFVRMVKARLPTLRSIELQIMKSSQAYGVSKMFYVPLWRMRFFLGLCWVKS